MSLASDSSETGEVIIVRFGTMTTSDMRMYHVLIKLTLTFIQGHTNLNHENNKGLIISETIQAMAMAFAVRIVRLKVYLKMSKPISWPSNMTTLNLQNLIQYLSYYIRTWLGGRLTGALYDRFDNLDLDTRSQLVGKC